MSVPTYRWESVRLRGINRKSFTSGGSLFIKIRLYLQFVIMSPSEQYSSKIAKPGNEGTSNDKMPSSAGKGRTCSGVRKSSSITPSNFSNWLPNRNPGLLGIFVIDPPLLHVKYISVLLQTDT